MTCMFEAPMRPGFVTLTSKPSDRVDPHPFAVLATSLMAGLHCTQAKPRPPMFLLHHHQMWPPRYLQQPKCARFAAYGFKHHPCRHLRGATRECTQTCTALHAHSSIQPTSASCLAIQPPSIPSSRSQLQRPSISCGWLRPCHCWAQVPLATPAGTAAP
jgi:hypothetical protein